MDGRQRARHGWWTVAGRDTSLNFSDSWAADAGEALLTHFVTHR